MMRLYLKAAACLLLGASIPSQAYTYLTCGNGLTLDFNSGHMTFNYANNLSAAQKTAISLGHSRLTAFSDSSISTIDNGDSSFYSGNDENEIYLDGTLSTAACAIWFSSSSTTCTVVEADMQYGNQSWTTVDNSQHFPFSSGRSMTATAVHEGGHCLGMDHSNDLYNMMGSEFSYVTRQGVDAYYGPGEDLSDGLIDLHGKKSGVNAFRDVGVTVMRYDGASGEYSTHDFGVLRNAGGSSLQIVGSYVGQPMHRVMAGSTIQMELTLENNGELFNEAADVAYYLSTNDIISTSDSYLGEDSFDLGRNSPNETEVSVTIPAGTAPGNYFLGAFIDYNQTIPETTVANNAAYYPVNVVAATLPAVATNPATKINLLGATLNASVNPNGQSTTLHLDYGTSITYGSVATVGDIGSGTTSLSTGIAAYTLDCGETYHFRARAVSGGGTSFGSDRIFTTSACPPGCQ